MGEKQTYLYLHKGIGRKNIPRIHTQQTCCVQMCCIASRSVMFCLPRQASVMAARWIECMESGRLFNARTNWKLRIPPIRPQIQHAENKII